MELKLDLGCGRTELIIGEDTPLSLAVVSASGQEITLPDPRRRSDWPKIRVRDVGRGTERTFGAHELEARPHRFVARPPVPDAKLAPGEEVRWEDRLLRWVQIPRAGAYELTLLMQGPSGVASSQPVRLSVLPLQLASLAIAPADGVHHPLRYAAWVHDGGAKGATVILGAVNLGEDGPSFVQSDRVAELPAPPQAGSTLVPSVSPSRNLFPAHWLAYLSSAGLEGRYVLQRTPQRTAAPRRLEAPAARVVGPGVLDPTGATTLVPARAHVALWEPSPPRLRFHTFEPDGQITGGHAVDLGAGALAWGGATVLTGGGARFALVMQEDDDVEVRVLLHAGGGSAPVRAGRWRGAALGAAMTLALARAEAMIGAVVLRDDAGGLVVFWEVAGDGAVIPHPTLPLDAGGARLTRAFVDLSPAGRLLVIAETASGAWLHGGNDGILHPLPSGMELFGAPVEAQLSLVDVPFAVMAGAETGITYQALAHGHAHGH